MTLSKNRKYAFLADQGFSSIVRVKIANGAQKVIASGPPLVSPTDVTLGLDGKLYAVNASLTAKTIKVNPKTGKASVFLKGGKLKGPEGITVQPRKR